MEAEIDRSSVYDFEQYYISLFCAMKCFEYHQLGSNCKFISDNQTSL
jgi:hypothetical protein